MGPPRSWPSGPRRWYFTARSFSPQLVIMPRKENTHIQKMAPGPPAARAAATPAMEPVPMVEARAVAKAWKGDSPPFPPTWGRRNSEPAVARHQTGNSKS